MGTDLVPAGTYGLQHVKEAANLWAEELGGLGIVPSFPRIRIPSGGATIWEIPGADPQTPEHSATITGILVAVHKSSVLWLDSFEERNADDGRPDAYSVDGIVQVVPPETIEKCRARNLPAPLTDVARCPYHQWPNKGGVQLRGQGKAASEYFELYLFVAGNAIPWNISVPAGSHDVVRAYLSSVAQTLRSFSSVETVVGLTTDVNKQGIRFSKITLRRGGDLDPAEAEAAKAYSKGIEAIVKQDPFAQSAFGDADVTIEDTPQGTFVGSAQPMNMDAGTRALDEAFAAAGTPVAAGDIDL